jgi:type I pantothenate kinase
MSSSGRATDTAVSVAIARILPHRDPADVVKCCDTRTIAGVDADGYRPLADAVAEHVAAAGGAGPVLVGLGGPVCVGKSTTAALVRALLAPVETEIVSTDGFLLPNEELERRGITMRKGFPESYDVAHLERFLEHVRTDTTPVRVPEYSHETYDVVTGPGRELVHAAVVIVEGVNALQFADAFDVTVYVDAPEPLLVEWYTERIVDVFAAAPPGSFYATLGLGVEEQRQFAREIWASINHLNLVEHIAPTRAHAGVVVEKGAGHAVERVRFGDPSR